MNNLHKIKNFTYTYIQNLFNNIPVYLNFTPINSDGSFQKLPIIIIHRQSVKFSDRIIGGGYTKIESIWNISCIANTSEECDNIVQAILNNMDNSVFVDSDIGEIRNYIESIEDSMETESELSQIDINMRQILTKL